AVRGRLLLYRGYLRSLALQPDEARKWIKQGIEETRSCRDVSLVIGYCVLASLEGRLGNYAAAFARLGDVERLMHAWDIPPIYYLAAITLIKCELWLAQGQTELAGVWLQRLGGTYGGQAATPPECSPLLPLHVELLQAGLERREGRPEEAARRLDRLARSTRENGALLPARLALGQLAALHLEQGREREALATLQQAMEGAVGGALLPLHELLVQQPEWLREQLQRFPACPGAQRMRALLPEPPAEPAGSAGEVLSGRELAVLELIAQGLSNQEISERLFISLHTVKSHARHINDKLGVERRTQAVARAKHMGLLR
ncbi:TPA: LuxR C-terminal-related transcriptional regulator, partial [Pseudomonas aeruginosa]